ncbi:MAG: L-fucose/L-arabinose isomerase family protein [Bacteroidota bacterium]
MTGPKIALLTFAEHRNDFFQKRRPLLEQYLNQVQSILGKEMDITTFEPIRSLEKAREIVALTNLNNFDCAIFYFPIWVAPNFATVMANLIRLPILLLANDDIATSSLPGMLGCGAALDQVGIAHRRIWGRVEDPKVLNSIKTFANAARAVKALKGLRYGVFGGRSLGIYSAGIDPSQWQQLYGIDVEHFDQLEIVRRAEKQDRNEVIALEKWLENQGLKFAFNNLLFTKEHLELQIRSYLGTREIVTENNLDFISIKCQPEMSNGYCLQCLNVALLNDRYDANGAKTAIPCACEADGDGALTMKVLNLLSGGKPTTLMDVRAVIPEEGILLLNNCGTMAPYFAGRSEDPRSNFSEVTLVPHVFGEAGGGSVQFTCARGPLTLARLCRKGGRYWLAIGFGDVIADEKGLIAQSTRCWPHAVLKTDMDLSRFVEAYGSNHIHAVSGDYRRELLEFSRILGINAELYSGGEFNAKSKLNA